MMRSLLQLITVSTLFGPARPCAPTDPGTIPGVPAGPTTSTTTLPPCCPTNLYVYSPRSLFNPALVACPDDAMFICSADKDASTGTTMIVINGNQTIASGPDGMNCFATVTCNAQKRWQTEMGTIVETIQCK